MKSSSHTGTFVPYEGARSQQEPAWRSVCAAVLVLIGMSACTRPSEGVAADELLHYFIDVPSIPLPIETPPNSSNPAFLKTLELANSVKGRRGYYVSLFEEVLTSWNGPTVTSSTYAWSYKHPDGVSGGSLQVTYGDTITFQGNWYGTAYGIITPTYGWHFPLTGDGALRTEQGVADLRWGPVSGGTELGGLFGIIGIGVVDSLDGGATLTVVDDFGVPFKAGWDRFGNGWYSGTWYGAGEW